MKNVLKTIILFMLFINTFIFASCKEESKFTLYLNYNCEEIENETITLSINEEYKLPVPSRDGYVFIGWEDNSKNILETIIITDKNIRLIAKWEEVKKSYSISYKLNGGNLTDNVKYEYSFGEDYLLPIPSYQGLAFLGWFDNLNFEGDEILSTKSLNKDLVLYAKFGNPKIIYNMDDGYFLDDVKYEYVIGEEYKLPEPEREDYIFLEWYETSDFSGEAIKKISSTSTKTIVLYAKWEYMYEVKEIEYFLAGGSFLSDVPSTYPEGKGCLLPVPYREGYKFLGWYDLSMKRIINELNEREYGNKNLIAKWEKIYNYSRINYVLNGGTLPNSAPVLYPETKGLELISPVRNGYFFRGYYYNSDFSGNRVKEIDAKKIGDITLYAKWEEAKFENAYISFYGDSMTAFKDNIPEEFKYFYPFNDVESVEDMWYYQVIKETNSKLLVNNSYGGTAVYGGTNQGIDEKRIALLGSDGIDPDIIIIYLGLNDVVNQRTISMFRDAYTQMIESIQKIYPDSKLFLCTLGYETKTNESSLGLRDAFSDIIETIANEKDCEIIRFKDTLTVDNYKGNLVDVIHVNSKGMKMLSSEAIRVLKNYFTNINGFEINYELNGGRFLTPALTTFKDLKVNAMLNEPIREGYKFLGWYNENNELVTCIKAYENKNFNLSAKWEKIEKKDLELDVKIIDAYGNESSKKVSYGDKLEKVENTSNKYVWMEGTSIYNFDNPITENIVIREVWSGIYEIISNTFKDHIFDDLTILKKYDTSVGIIEANWQSSDKYTLNLSNGRVNPGREEIEVSIIGKFTLNNEMMNYSFSVIVNAIEFKTLENIKPTFAYIYSNIANLKFDNLTTNAIDVAHYGFARVTQNSEVSIGELSYLDKVLTLRKYGIRVLLCIGGYGEAGIEFSNTALTQEKREKFAKSIVETVEKYHFDGVDIDWEYPGYKTGRETSIDKPNYTLLMEEIRKQLKAKNNDYIISAALPGGNQSYSRYELNKLDNILDYIHLMTYDLQSSGKVTHHAAPFDGDYTPFGSVEQTVNIYLKSGISKEKLVVGAAFYGRMFYLKGEVNDVLGNTNIIKGGVNITFTNLYDNYLSKAFINGSGVYRYFDEKSKAPYIYDSKNKIVISYDDSVSIKAKMDYIKDNDLGGIMFWDYGEDNTHILLNAIYMNK